MSTKGIAFSAPMVRALLAGTKTQTRRLLRNPEYFGCPTGDCPHERQAECDAAMAALSAKEANGYAPGDRLYVREGWIYINRQNEPGIGPEICIGYLADGPDLPNRPMIRVSNDWYDRSDHWSFQKKGGRPSIHMPRWASRLWLEVTEVRVQRLQDISEEDARAEGVVWQEPTEEDIQWARERAELGEGDGSIEGVWTVPGMGGPGKADIWGVTAVQSYRFLWNTLHTEPGQRWDDNPWIVAVSFVVHNGNVDEVAHG